MSAQEEESPVVEVVTFCANEQCAADPALFAHIRDAAASLSAEGMRAQYWGEVIESRSAFYWLLEWESRAHLAAAPHPALFDRLQALVSAPPKVLHVAFPINTPAQWRSCLAAPITGLDLYRIKPAQVAEAEATVGGIMAATEELGAPGFRGVCWGRAFGDPEEAHGRGMYVTAWENVEAHLQLATDPEHEEFLNISERMMDKLDFLNIQHVALRRHE